MATFYRIVDFKQRFTVARSREVKTMTWVAIPNKLDGDGYTELMDHPNAAAHYGAWIVMVAIASKCGDDGLLARDHRGTPRPHDSASLSRISRIPAQVFDELIPRLTQIGWLESVDETGQEVIETSNQCSTTSNRCAPASNDPATTLRNVTVRNGTVRDETLRNEDETERDETIDAAAPLVVSDCQAVVNHYQTYHPRAKPSEKERKLIRARLKDGYSAQDLCDAIDGNHLSPWHCGENEDGREYHALDLIVRSGDKVAQFIACKESPRSAVTSLQTKRNAAAADSYLEKRKAINGILG